MVSKSCVLSLTKANHFADGIFRHAAIANRWLRDLHLSTLGLDFWGAKYAASRFPNQGFGITQIRHQRFFSGETLDHHISIWH